MDDKLRRGTGEGIRRGTSRLVYWSRENRRCCNNNVLTVSDANVEETNWLERGAFCIPQYDDGEYSPAIGEMVRCGDRFSGCGGALLSLYGWMKRYHQLSQLIETIEETTVMKFQVNGRKWRFADVRRKTATVAVVAVHRVFYLPDNKLQWRSGFVKPIEI